MPCFVVSHFFVGYHDKFEIFLSSYLFSDEGVFSRGFRKFIMMIIWMSLLLGLYHFSGYTGDVRGDLWFSGLICLISIFTIFVVWYNHIKKYISMCHSFGYMTFYEATGTELWRIFAMTYHHLITPLVMMMRLMANFGIGQGGKYFVFIVFGNYPDKFSVYFLTMIFFFYEFFVLVLQSYIFVILSAELVGGLHPVISPSSSKSVFLNLSGKFSFGLVGRVSS
uniref:ATP synthase F0 subunit 6 n=1 Tax=Camallanus cotti TaxID=375143 RepID=A0A343LEM3_9BILA|nr:ATP synthase F0 subunit 6 [Camallanus cotti]ATO58497.1 ATP synthase F0 subunit 6 [Camallanus cotti]